MIDGGKRILVLAIRAIGDAVLITPILRLLKKRVPATYLAVLADGASAEVLRYNPHVDHLFVIDRHAQRVLPFLQRFQNSLRLLRALRAEQFDIAVDLFSGPRSALLAWACGAHDRYGEDFRSRVRGFLYNHPMTILRNGRHLIEQKLELIRPLSGHVERCQEQLQVTLMEEERDRARRILAKYGLAPPRLVGLVPGAGSVFRQWPPGRFAAVGDRLAEDYQAKILLFGGHEDVPICRTVSNLMSYKAVDLSGMTSLRELMALFMELDLVISNVTGPMHLAVATGRPKVIGLYGAADTVQYAPWGSNGVALTKGMIKEAYWRKVDYSRDFKEYLLQITEQDVLSQVRVLMGDWSSTKM